jgi:CRISPR/Cas system CSM-associated protein Csm2 small subunit
MTKNKKKDYGNNPSFSKEKEKREKEKMEKNEAIKKFVEADFLISPLNNDLVDTIKNFMNYCAKDITSSQLRNVYSIILDDKGNAAKRVKIAYTAARNNTQGMSILLNKLDNMLSNNGEYETIRNFTEACVAFHKYFETLKK